MAATAGSVAGRRILLRRPLGRGVSDREGPALVSAVLLHRGVEGLHERLLLVVAVLIDLSGRSEILAYGIGLPPSRDRPAGGVPNGLWRGTPSAPAAGNPGSVVGRPQCGADDPPRLLDRLEARRGVLLHGALDLDLRAGTDPAGDLPADP